MRVDIFNRSRALEQTLLAVVGQVHFREPSLSGGAVRLEPAAGDVLQLVEARVLVGEGFGPRRGQFRGGLSELIHVSLDSGFARGDRKSTRLNSSHLGISYAVFCLKKET